MTRFSDFGLNPQVLKAVEEAGYETPTPIQADGIPPALEGRDVLGIAQTGTGKTASFTLPMITRLARGRARARMPRSLVLCPTRELAAQVAENFDTYSTHVKLTKALLIGGVSFKEQDTLIDRGVDVLIATPGRLLDHFERGKLLLTGIEIMVVDEADRMLDMGFIPDIERIFSLTPFTRQTLFFSATMAPEIERLTRDFLSAPVRVEVARQATTNERIDQGVVMFRPTRRDREGTEKRRVLRALIDAEGDACTNAIIFCNRKTDVDILAKSLKKHGYDAAPIHGDLDQSQRTRTLDGFRDGSLKILVASDVAARGLDIPSVSHVFNFDVPGHSEDYVHRIGRTARAGRDGKALMIGSPRDSKNLEAIEKLVEKRIPRVTNPIPSLDGASGESGEEAPGYAGGSGRSGGARENSGGHSGDGERSRRSRRRSRGGDRRREGGEGQSRTGDGQAAASGNGTEGAIEAAASGQPVTGREESAERGEEGAPKRRRKRGGRGRRGNTGDERDGPRTQAGTGQDPRDGNDRRSLQDGQGQQQEPGGGRERKRPRERGGSTAADEEMPNFISKSFSERRDSATQ